MQLISGNIFIKYSIYGVIMPALQQSGENPSKRKRDDELAELEVDLNAAEPPSKKALRKAKRSKIEQNSVQDADPVDNAAEAPSSNDRTVHDALSNKSRSGHGIWIGNLAFTTTKEDLMTFLTSDPYHSIEPDQITRVHMPHGPAKLGKPQNKGFAYVDFTDAKTLQQGLELSEKLLGGRRVLIKNATNFEGRPSSKEELSNGKPPNRRIFVGNLPFETTQETLESHFGVCGTIAKIQIATFEDSGKCRGFAWIEFEQLSSAQAAMRGWAENGGGQDAHRSRKRTWLKKMNGRELRMEFAEDAATRYNKRFGKEGTRTAVKSDDDAQEAITEIQERPEDIPRIRPNREAAQKIGHKQRYEEPIVKRLTGAITPSQGTKVTFE